MTRLLKLLIAAAVLFAALMVGHHNAQAAALVNTPDPRLDVVASSVAGHPVKVFCENDPAAWAAGSSPMAWGYTYPPHWNPWLTPERQNTVWIHPWPCGTLHALLDTPTLVSLDAAAVAIHVLVHESVHQRDGVFGDCTGTDESCEGRTDCMALTLDEGVAVGFFGYPATVNQTTVTTAYKTVRRKVRGHWRRVRTKRLLSVVTQVPNPDLNLLHQYQQLYHNDVGTRYPAYKGDC